MSRSCHRDRGDSGFTLIEVTVAMTVLVIVLVLSGSLIFSMKSFAQKQQSFAEPRQTARRAMNYLAYYVRGASDMNMMQPDLPMPNALVNYYVLGGTTKRAAYDNLTDANLGDLGTDLFTVAKPVAGSAALRIVGAWTGSHTTTNLSVLYSQGCGDGTADSANLTAFNQAVGYDSTAGASSLFMIYDPNGTWQYYQINAAPTCDCSQVNASSPAVISASIAPGGLLNIWPPGRTAVGDLGDVYGCSDSNPCYMTAGMQFVTFRVRTVNGTPRLEQLALPGRLFDDALDGPGTSFTPLLDNVEDLQVAYIYGDGTIWNSGVTGRLLSGTDYPDNVPNMQWQALAPKPYDAVNVRGIRLSVVARSARPLQTMFGGVGSKAPAVTPPEDSAAAYAPGYYHYRLTSTIMIQNRVLGN